MTWVAPGWIMNSAASEMVELPSLHLLSWSGTSYGRSGTASYHVDFLLFPLEALGFGPGIVRAPSFEALDSIPQEAGKAFRPGHR